MGDYFLLYTFYKIVRIGNKSSNKLKDGIWRKWVTCAEAAGRNAIHLSLPEHHHSSMVRCDE